MGDGCRGAERDSTKNSWFCPTGSKKEGKETCWWNKEVQEADSTEEGGIEEVVQGKRCLE